jgi:cell division protease FtsH
MYQRQMKMQGGDGESVFSMGKSQAKLTTSKVKFSDIAGIKEEKEELIEIVDYLKFPQKYVAMGARTPRGVILYGPPGTGKTLLAKAVAGEASVPFFQVSGSAFEDMLVGVGAKRIRDLFKKAKQAAPAIIFIDEIDSVASKRGKNEIMGGGGLADQTINQLLAEMDGFSTKTGVVVMAATNRLDVLDDAILRPGRFDRHIQVTLPDIKERTDILKIHARNKNISASVSLEDIARRTPGFSGAQLENVLNEATLLAVRFNKTTIGMSEIDEAIDRVIAGPAKKSRVITEEEKEQIAYHEAGHAIVGLYTKGSEKVEKITIIPRGNAGGYTLTNPEKQENMLQKKSELKAMVAALLGGRASEEIRYGADNVSTGASNDLYKATGIVRAMVMQLGMSEIGMTQFVPSEGSSSPYQQKLYSDATAYKMDNKIESIIQSEYKVAKQIISQNKKELDLIVECLLLLETIVKPQIDYIHKNKKLPAEAVEAKKRMAKTKADKKSVKN